MLVCSLSLVVVCSLGASVECMYLPYGMLIFIVIYIAGQENEIEKPL